MAMSPPDRAVWWMALLFAVGSAMFLVPAMAALASSAAWIAVTFFSGSVFFTSASLLQLITAAELPHRFRPRTRRRPNGDLGIKAVHGVIDGGGNIARHNGDPRQCTHVACR